MPISCTPVSPPLTATAAAARMRASIIAGVAAGIFATTRSTALSTRTPVGSPRSSRKMRPPSGSLVSRVMPAAASAALDTHTACPSTRSRIAGRSPTARSSDARVGNSLGAHRF
jgi:hypothetical protein